MLDNLSELQNFLKTFKKKNVDQSPNLKYKNYFP